MKDYKKILEGVVNIINSTEKSGIGFADICTYIGENCPELMESEDERVRKEIIKIFNVENFEGYNVDNAEAIEWLEKQKPVEWSEEDALQLNEAIEAVKESSYSSERKDAVIDWLYSLRPQKHGA